MSSFQWSIVPRPTPLAYYQSLHPPDWESGSHGSHNTAPGAAASFDTRTWGLRSRCGSPQAPFSRLSAPSVTWRQSYEIIGHSLEKRGFFLGFFVLFWSSFLSLDLGKTFWGFLYLCDRCSLVLETSSAHAKRDDLAEVFFEAWILTFRSGCQTDNV